MTANTSIEEDEFSRLFEERPLDPEIVAHAAAVRARAEVHAESRTRIALGLAPANDNAVIEKPKRRSRGPDFANDHEAWIAHLRSLANEHDVAKAYHSRSARFNRLGVRDVRRAETLAEIARRAPHRFPEAILEQARKA